MRGSTTKFYEWLEGCTGRLLDGPPIWTCGDCHVGNLGPLSDAKGRVAVQIRDLDQTVIGNPVHDLIRLGLSLASAARGSDLPGITTATMLEELIVGYREGFGADFDKDGDRSHRPKTIQSLLAQSVRRKWHQLAEEPLGIRFWALTRMERNAVAKLFETEPVQHLLTSLKDCGTDDPVELIDVAYWIKGCSSLGRLRYAALLWIGKGKTSTLCLADIKEGTRAAAPRAPKCKMPRDNAVRVVMGAEALSPNLGQRMIATRLLEKSVVVRELTAADLKIEADSMTRVAAANLARYLGGVVGRAHGRQMDSPNGVFGKPSSQGTIRSRWMLRRGCGRAWWNSSPFTKQPANGRPI